MALMEKIAKGVRRHAEKSKEKKHESKHVVVSSHKGGFMMKKHEHGRHEPCDGDCETSIHKSVHEVGREMKSHLGGNEDKGEDEEE